MDDFNAICDTYLLDLIKTGSSNFKVLFNKALMDVEDFSRICLELVKVHHALGHHFPLWEEGDFYYELERGEFLDKLRLSVGATEPEPMDSLDASGSEPMDSEEAPGPLVMVAVEIPVPEAMET